MISTMSVLDSSTKYFIFITNFFVVGLPNVLQAFEQFTNGRTHIGVKKMGVLDNKVFANAATESIRLPAGPGVQRAGADGGVIGKKARGAGPSNIPYGARSLNMAM
jgi:hypothetical protein